MKKIIQLRVDMENLEIIDKEAKKQLRSRASFIIHSALKCIQNEKVKNGI